MTVNVMLTGRLIADPTRRETKSGKPMVTTTLAAEVPDPRNADVDPSMLIGVVVFGDLAEVLETHTKGDRVAVSGVLQRSHWTGEDGVERERLNVLVDGVLSARASREAARVRRAGRTTARAEQPCGGAVGA